jgi:hypothetical protein
MRPSPNALRQSPCFHHLPVCRGYPSRICSRRSIGTSCGGRGSLRAGGSRDRCRTIRPVCHIQLNLSAQHNYAGDSKCRARRESARARRRVDQIYNIDTGPCLDVTYGANCRRTVNQPDNGLTRGAVLAASFSRISSRSERDCISALSRFEGSASPMGTDPYIRLGRSDPDPTAPDTWDRYVLAHSPRLHLG